MPVRLILTQGTTADCSQAIALIQGIQAEHLLADKGYDSNEIPSGHDSAVDHLHSQRSSRLFQLELRGLPFWIKPFIKQKV